LHERGDVDAGLAVLCTWRAGAEENATAAQEWGYVLAFLVVLIKLGVPPRVVLDALKAVPR